MQKFSGKNFTFETSAGYRFNIHECEGSINSGLKAVTGGGFIESEPEQPTVTLKLEYDQFQELLKYAPEGGLEAIEPFDITFAGSVGEKRSKIEVFGIKLKAPSNLLNLIKQDAENMIVDVEGLVTDRESGYVKADGKFLMTLPGVTDGQ